MQSSLNDATNTHEYHKLCKTYLIKIHLLLRDEEQGENDKCQTRKSKQITCSCRRAPQMFNNGNPQSTPRTQMQDSAHVCLHTPHFINFPLPAAPEHLQLQLWLPESQLGDDPPVGCPPIQPVRPSGAKPRKRKPQQSKHTEAEGREFSLRRM